MRMWMIPTAILCRKHLLGEHLETHMFNGALAKKKQLNGYFKTNCFEPLSLRKRHEELVEEMNKRGYNHKSEFILNDMSYLGDKIFIKINSDNSLKDIITRCKDCEKRYKLILDK